MGLPAAIHGVYLVKLPDPLNAKSQVISTSYKDFVKRPFLDKPGESRSLSAYQPAAYSGEHRGVRDCPGNGVRLR